MCKDRWHWRMSVSLRSVVHGFDHINLGPSPALRQRVAERPTPLTWPEPPPYQPDRTLIGYIERGQKPSQDGDRS